MSTLIVQPRYDDGPILRQFDWPVERPQPWNLNIYEPLATKAPGPHLARAYCCYIRTVIFYVRPTVVRPWHHPYRWQGGWHVEEPGQRLEQWDQVEYLLTWETLLEFDNEIFKCGGGKVVWRNRRWWLMRYARRERAES